LLCGVDGLYLSYYGEVPKEVYETLSECGEINTSVMRFNVRHISRGTYTIVLDNDSLSVSLGNSAASVFSPSVYLQVKSEFIWSVGLEDARRQAVIVAADIYNKEPEREQVSRLDIFADILWPKEFYPGDIEKFSTRAKSKATYHDNGKVSGFTIGKGDITARIYDKTLEIHRSRKDWLYDLWRVGQDARVWRVEFQLRRDALKDFGIETFDDLINSLQALWDYCVNEWLRVRAGGKRSARLISFWEQAQMTKLGLGDDSVNLVRRERMRSGMTEKQAADQMAGITRSYARSYEIENHSHALDLLIPRIRERLI
jgi:hypothetical protein